MHSLTVYVAKYLVILPPVVILAVFFRLSREQKRHMAILLTIGGLVALLCAKIGNIVFYDPRPFVVGHYSPLFMSSLDNGFPSDHTLLSAFLGFVMLTFSRPLGVVLLLIAATIGTARVAAHVHHAWDILGGFAFAFLGWLVATLIYKWMQGRLERRAATQ